MVFTDIGWHFLSFFFSGWFAVCFCPFEFAQALSPLYVVVDSYIHMDEMGFNVYTMLCSKIYFSLECLRLFLSGTLHLRAEIAKAIDSFSEFYNGNAPTPYDVQKSPSFIWEANFENSIKNSLKIIWICKHSLLQWRICTFCTQI